MAKTRRTDPFINVDTEKQFLQVLRRFCRNWRRRNENTGYRCDYCFLVENSWRKDIAWMFDKYFKIASHAYDWQRGNAKLQWLTDEWETEFKTKKK